MSDIEEIREHAFAISAAYNDEAYCCFGDPDAVQRLEEAIESHWPPIEQYLLATPTPSEGEEARRAHEALDRCIHAAATSAADHRREKFEASNAAILAKGQG